MQATKKKIVFLKKFFLRLFLAVLKTENQCPQKKKKPEGGFSAC